MKRIFCILLSLALLLSAAWAEKAAPAEEAAPAAGNRIPDVGAVLHGFEVREIRDYPMAGGQLVLFEHQKTGAQLLWIANDDTNRVFEISFLTRPHDNKGMPHVFEHATLFGSEKYPSSSLFFNVSMQTYNTYMNAYTTDACTGYPLASLSEEQLLHLADFYVDSCFHPMIMTDESIYRTQAWHYKLPEPDGELSYEGVVYTEMTGAVTLPRAAMTNANRAAFPGSSLSYEYGGLPEAIPDLTWDELRGYHDLYYHPSNSFTVLYGQLNRYEAFLELLDNEFKNYEKKEFPWEDSGYTRITEPVVEKIPYPTAQGTDTANQSVVVYYVVLPGMREDPEQERLVDHLCLMLNQSGSVLQQKMQQAFPAAQVSCGRELAGPDDAVAFHATGMNEEDGEAFRALVNEALRDVAENGFSAEMTDSVMAAQRLNALLTMESANPVESIVTGFIYYYAVTGNPFSSQEMNDALSLMAEENESGALKEAAAKWLADAPLYTLTTTYPAPGAKEEQDAALKAKLAEIKAGMTEEELQKIVADSNAEAKKDDTTAYMAQIKAVGVEDLPEEYRRYEISDTTDENGIRYVEAAAGVEGVGQAAVMLDAAALPQEDLHWLRLYTRLLGQMDTDAHTKAELDTLLLRYFYQGIFGVTLTDCADGSFHPYLSAEWTAMDEDLAQGYELAEEVLFRTQFTDTAKLADQITAQKTAVRSSIDSGSYQVMLYRGLGDRYPFYRTYDYLNNTEYYRFLTELEAQVKEAPDAVAAKLTEIQAFFRNRAGAVSTYAGTPEGAALNRPLAQAFLMKLDSVDREPAVWDLPIPAQREALIEDGNIQFNIIAATMDDLGMEEFDYGLAAVAALVSDRILLPVLRDQMGVYTPMNNVMYDKGMYLLTYRDPSIRETFDVYASLADQIAALDVDQEALNGYIMSTYSQLAKPAGELSGAGEAITNHLGGYDQDLKLRCMRQLKAVTPETVKNAAEYYRKAWENGVHSTSGSAGAINANADLYDVILNPFGAQDASKVELTDLPEDHPAFGAVRFMFENRLFLADEESRIRPDDESTVGDAAAALFAALGMGTADDPATAAATLAQYGILPPDAAPDAPMTWGTVDQILAGLSAAVGQTLPSVSTEENRETVMTRGDLAQALAPLFGYAAE